MNDYDRITPLGWFHYAHSYAASALALDSFQLEATHSDAPVRHLYRHAIELYLKAFLLQSGLSPELLRDKYGHNTERLIDAARERGLVVIDSQRDEVAFLKDALPDRYLETGYRQVLGADTMLGLCRHLNGSIGPLIYTAASIVRAVPQL